MGLLVALVSVNPISRAGASAQTRVTFRLDTNYLPKHGIFFAAQGLGFYKQEGLDVSFQPSTGSYDTSVAVGQGRADFGFADFDTMVKAVATGASVEQLASIHAVNPSAIITLPKYKIRHFRNLRGKRIAGEPAESATLLFPLALELCHMSMKDVDFISVDSRAKLPGLEAGKWEGFVAYSVSDPATMVGQGLTPVVVPYSECGFSGYSNGLIANTKTIRAQPELVQRFVTATLRGIQWACTNRTGAAKNTMTVVPSINLQAAEAGIRLACRIIWTPEAARHGMGYMDPAQVGHTVGLARQFLGLKGAIDLSILYTNRFNVRAHILNNTAVEAPK